MKMFADVSKKIICIINQNEFNLKKIKKIKINYLINIKKKI